MRQTSQFHLPQGWRQEWQQDGTVRVWRITEPLVSPNASLWERNLGRLFLYGLPIGLFSVALIAAIAAIAAIAVGGGSRLVLVPIPAVLCIGLLLAAFSDDIVQKEWRVGPKRLEKRSRFWIISWTRPYRGGAFELALTSDGQGALYVLGADRRQFLISGLSREEACILGKFLAKLTGWPLIPIEYTVFPIDYSGFP
jgi:hypothetical protein